MVAAEFWVVVVVVVVVGLEGLEAVLVGIFWRGSFMRLWFAVVEAAVPRLEREIAVEREPYFVCCQSCSSLKRL